MHRALNLLRTIVLFHASDLHKVDNRDTDAPHHHTGLRPADLSQILRLLLQRLNQSMSHAQPMRSLSTMTLARLVCPFISIVVRIPCSALAELSRKFLWHKALV